MANKARNPMLYADAQRAFEESALVGQAANVVQGSLRTSGIKQKDIGTRLAVTSGRVSQMISNPGNMTLKSLASLCWALGVRIELRPQPMSSELAHGPAEVIQLPPMQGRTWEFSTNVKPFGRKASGFDPEFAVTESGNLESFG